MGKQPTIFFFGVLFCLGGIIQIATSATWTKFDNVDFGERYMLTGQAVGEIFYILGCRRLFKGYGFFVAAAEYLISLSLVDIITIIYLDPFEVSISKYTGFLVASFMLLLRWNKYLTKNE